MFEGSNQKLMAKQLSGLNKDVTKFLDEYDHPLRKEIEELREAILAAHTSLEENIKWNGPNYSVNGNDRVTMRVHPPKNIQLIFHRGAKVLAQPKEKLIDDKSEMLVWKTNDRAVATFKNMDEIITGKKVLVKIIGDWIKASSKE